MNEFLAVQRLNVYAPKMSIACFNESRSYCSSQATDNKQPWFIQQDQFLLSASSPLRNLGLITCLPEHLPQHKIYSRLHWEAASQHFIGGRLLIIFLVGVVVGDDGDDDDVLQFSCLGDGLMYASVCFLSSSFCFTSSRYDSVR